MTISEIETALLRALHVPVRLWPCGNDAATFSFAGHACLVSLATGRVVCNSASDDASVRTAMLLQRLIATQIQLTKLTKAATRVFENFRAWQNDDDDGWKNDSFNPLCDAVDSLALHLDEHEVREIDIRHGGEE